MHAKQKWLLVSFSSFIIAGAILGSSGFLNKVTTENSKIQEEIKSTSVENEKQTNNTFNNINEQLVQNDEQMKEDKLKQSALKEVDSRTAYEQFSSYFTAYKDMHAKHSIHYANKQANGIKISLKVLNELKKKGELITYFEHKLASNTKTG